MSGIAALGQADRSRLGAVSKSGTSTGGLGWRPSAMTSSTSVTTVSRAAVPRPGGPSGSRTPGPCSSCTSTDREQAAVHEPGDDDGTTDQSEAVAHRPEQEQLGEAYRQAPVGRAQGTCDPARRDKRWERPCTHPVYRWDGSASSLGPNGCTRTDTDILRLADHQGDFRPPLERLLVGDVSRAGTTIPICPSFAAPRTNME